MKKILLIIINILLLMSMVACQGTKQLVPDNGTVDVFLYLEGGSGRATVEKSSTMTIENGERTVRVIWSSPNYDYMIVDGNKYLPINESGNSQFQIPVLEIGEPFKVIGDTVAMSTPHEIEYELTVSLEEIISEADNDAVSKAAPKKNIDIVQEWINTNLNDEKDYPLEYATGFSIKNYNDNASIITTADGSYYLIKGDADIDVDKLPDGLSLVGNDVNRIYVVGTGSMDYFVALDELNKVKYSSLEEKSWYLDDVIAAMNNNEIVYAGKYSAPDYELLLHDGCDLIIENTMIMHDPEVLNKLKNLGFPVIIDSSSLEASILARMEWVKLFGHITGRIDKAEEVFNIQKEAVNGFTNKKGSKKVGFFSVTSSGDVTIRKSQDYICNMIEIAGGEYGFKDLSHNEGTGSNTIQAEAFYALAKDCDILIYNGTIEGNITSKEELINKFSLISKCRAFEEDSIYSTLGSFYQSSMELGDITEDIYKIINGEDSIKYLVKLK